MKHYVIWVICFLLMFNMTAVSTLAVSPAEQRPVLTFSIGDDDLISAGRILNYAASELGYELRLVPQSTFSAIISANAGVVDGFVRFAPGLQEQYPNLLMGTEEVTSMKYYTYTRQAERMPNVTDWADFSGKRVGHVAQRAHVISHLPNDVVATQYVDFETMMQGLANGEIDIAIYHQVEYQEYTIPPDIALNTLIDTVPSYTYVNKKNKDLLVELDAVFRRMNADGTMDQIKNNEYRPNTSTNKVVLYISSYSTDMEWDLSLRDSFRQPYQEGLSVETYFINLDILRLGIDPQFRKNLLLSIHSSFLTKVPDVIVASDDEALQFVMENYNSTFLNTPIVFGGINNFTPDLLSNFSGEMTGVTEHLSVEETVSQMLTMYPDSKNLYVINDYTVSGRKWQADIEKQLSAYSDRLNIEYNDNVPFDELLQKMQTLPKNALVLQGFYFLDGDNNYHLLSDSTRAFEQLLQIPVFCLDVYTAEYRPLGGFCESANAQGATMHNLVAQVLGGVPASAIPIVKDTSDQNKWVFDWTIMTKFGITQRELPEGSLILHKELTFYQRYPQLALAFVIAGAAALIVIATMLFFMRKQRKQNEVLLKTQKSLHTAEELLQKDAEIMALREKQQEMMALAPIAFMVSVNGVVKNRNNYTKQIFNLDIDDAFSRILLNQESELMARLTKESRLSGHVLSLRVADGTDRRFLANFALVDYEGQRAVVLWAVDVEDNERQHALFMQLQADLQHVLDALPVGVIINRVDSLETLYCNETYEKMFGYHMIDGRVEGPSMLAMSPEYQSDGRSSADILREHQTHFAQTEETLTYDWQFSFSDDILEARVSSSKIFYDGVPALASIVQNITYDKQRTALLQSTAEKEKEANMIKSRFLVNMSHEIRTPMNAIIGLSEIALLKRYDREAHETFRKVNDSAKNLLSIINDVLDFSKIEAEKLELFEEDFVLEETLANATLVASQRIEGKRVEMLLHLDDRVPAVVKGDKTRLWQILKNLLDNSAKFTTQGRIVLRVFPTEGVSEEGIASITFVIQDTGMGMKPDQLEKLFTPFEQFHQNSTNAHTGTGLGMSITKQLVTMMSGTIAVESTWSVGTTTTIVIPFQVAQSNADRDFHSDALSNLRILVTDDDPVALCIMESILQRSGATAVCVASGQEAIAHVHEAHEHHTPFDLFILDYQLDGMTGIDVAEELHALHLENDPKLLMVSAYASRIIAQSIDSAGFADIIEKPFSPSNFLRKLSNVLDIAQTETVVDQFTKYEGASVLLVEDNAINQEVASSMLEMFGIVPVIANNGIEALACLAKQTFDLVLMDLLMPQMDGYQATRAIRTSDKPYKDVPIVAMTANVIKEQIDQCHAEGMNGHVGKPIDFDSLGAQLQKWLHAFAATATHDQPCSLVDNEIEGIDMASGLLRYRGNRDKYYRALTTFAEACPNPRKPFADAIANLKQTTQDIHTLKGVAGNLGLTTLYNAVTQLEKSLLDELPDKSFYTMVYDLYALFAERILTADRDSQNALRPLSEHIEAMARLIHKNQVSSQLQESPYTPLHYPTWDSLPDTLKFSNIQLARNVFRKISYCGYQVAATLEGAREVRDFTAEQVEILARQEHDDWVRGRVENGWRYASANHAEHKQSPYLVSFDSLPQAIRALDKDAVRNIFTLVHSLGLKIFDTTDISKTTQTPS